VLLDGSEEMLRIARQQGRSRQCGRANFHLSRWTQAGCLNSSMQPSFDIVVATTCWSMLRILLRVVRDIAHVLRRDAVLSILVRNPCWRGAKRSHQSRDWKLATASLSADTVVDSLYGEFVRLFAPEEVAICSPSQLGSRCRTWCPRVFRLPLVWKICQMQHTLKYSSGVGAWSAPRVRAIARYIQVNRRRSVRSSTRIRDMTQSSIHSALAVCFGPACCDWRIRPRTR